MANEHGLIAYLPAKGRSRGIPNKNLAPLGGKPLLEYTIRFALESRLFDAIFVSSDSEEVRALAAAAGVGALERPARLAQDSTRIAEALVCDLPEMERAHGPCELLACLLATSPLRRLQDLQSAVALARAHPDAPGVVSVSPLPCGVGQIVALEGSPQRIAPLSGIENLNALSQRQLHAPLYYPNGAIVVVRLEHFRRDPRFYVEGRTIGLPIDSVSAIDIDTPQDLELADLVMRSMKYY